MVNQVQTHSIESQINPAYSKILVAVDYFDYNSEVFESSLQLAQANDSQLMIFSAIQEPASNKVDLPIYSEMAGYGAIYSQEMLELEEKLIQENLAKQQNWLKKLAHQASQQGIEATIDYNYGEPGEQICDIAKKWGADLIVIGRRGRKGLSELLLGSVSNYVVHHATCSILVVQHQSDE